MRPRRLWGLLPIIGPVGVSTLSHFTAEDGSDIFDEEWARECPEFAQEVLCNGNVYSPTKRYNQSIRFRYRAMTPHCPIACQRCGAEFNFRRFKNWEAKYRHCTPDEPSLRDAWLPGDPDRMYKRILSSLRDAYLPTLLSAPSLDSGPYIVQMEDFLTPAECDIMIGETENLIARAVEGTVFLADNREAQDDEDATCFSTQAWCFGDCIRQDRFQSITRKIERLVGLPWRFAEELHLIRYSPGQEYGQHHDFIPADVDGVHGPRLFTLLMYLNDPAGGGETCFPALDRPLCVQPKAGRALLWPQVLNHDPEAKDNRTWHLAHGVTEGYKYASTVWFHLRDYNYSGAIGCSHLNGLEEDVYYEDDDEEAKASTEEAEEIMYEEHVLEDSASEAEGQDFSFLEDIDEDQDFSFLD